MWLACLLPILLLCLCQCPPPVAGCNEAVCASLVTKCLLLQACECDMSDKTNCSCCQDCQRCLAQLYTQCCDCVDLCPTQSPYGNLQATSTVEELPTPLPDLFNVLTDEPDLLGRWTILSYPAHLSLLYFTPPAHDLDLTPMSGSLDRPASLSRPPAQYENCTVAYMSQCMSLNKCRQGCQSMGAARYRWFHEYGCCQCISTSCLDFGKNTAQCSQCPPEEEVYKEDWEEYEYYEDWEDY